MGSEGGVCQLAAVPALRSYAEAGSLFRRAPSAAALGLVLGWATSAYAANDRVLYGPGPHWLDDVTAGLAMFQSEVTVGIDLDRDGVTDLVVPAGGPTTVVRGDARLMPIKGERPAHLAHLDLEIVSMTLAGEIPGLGAFAIAAGDGIANLAPDGLLHSYGSSDEDPTAPRVARDVFQIWFRIDVQGLVLHNPDPLRVEATIDRLPPIGSLFTMIGPPVVLVTDDGTPVMLMTEVMNRLVRPPARACDDAGVDAEAIERAVLDVASACRCVGNAGRYLAGCRRRMIAARVRAGLLNGRCKRVVRREAQALACRSLRPDSSAGHFP